MAELTCGLCFHRSEPWKGADEKEYLSCFARAPQVVVLTQFKDGKPIGTEMRTQYPFVEAGWRACGDFQPEVKK